MHEKFSRKHRSVQASETIPASFFASLLQRFPTRRLFFSQRIAAYRDRQLMAQSVLKRVAKIEVRASTLNLKFIGTLADVDFA